MMKFGVEDNQFNLIVSHILENLGQTKNPKLFIYGSRVKGNAHKYSDIDLLLTADYYDEKALSQINFSELNTVYTVDFVLDKNLFQAYADEIHSHMQELTLKEIHRFIGL